MTSMEISVTSSENVSSVGFTRRPSSGPWLMSNVSDGKPSAETVMVAERGSSERLVSTLYTTELLSYTATRHHSGALDSAVTARLPEACSEILPNPAWKVNSVLVGSPTENDTTSSIASFRQPDRQKTPAARPKTNN